MKTLFLAAVLTVTTLFSTALSAADTPANQAELEKEFLKFEEKAERNSKEELKGLVREDVLKKELAAVRGQQESTQGAAAGSQKKESESISD